MRTVVKRVLLSLTLLANVQYALCLQGFDELVARVHQLNNELTSVECALAELTQIVAPFSRQYDDASDENSPIHNNFTSCSDNHYVALEHDIVCTETYLVKTLPTINSVDDALNELQAALDICWQEAQQNTQDIAAHIALLSLLPLLDSSDDDFKQHVAHILEIVDEVNQKYRQSIKHVLPPLIDQSDHVRKSVHQCCLMYKDYLQKQGKSVELALSDYVEKRCSSYRALQEEFSDITKRFLGRFHQTIATAESMSAAHKKKVYEVFIGVQNSVESTLNWFVEHLQSVLASSSINEQKLAHVGDIFPSIAADTRSHTQYQDMCERFCLCEGILLNKITQGYVRCLSMLQDGIKAGLTQFMVQDEELSGKLERLIARLQVLESTWVHELDIQLASVAMQQKNDARFIREQFGKTVAQVTDQIEAISSDMHRVRKAQNKTLAQRECARIDQCAWIDDVDAQLNKALVQQRQDFDRRLQKLDNVAAQAQTYIGEAGKAIYVGASQIMDLLAQKHAQFILRMQQGIADFNCQMNILDDALCAKITCSQADLIKAADSAAVKAIQRLDDLRFHLVLTQEDVANLVGSFSKGYSVAGLITKIHTSIFPQLFLLRLLYCDCIPLPPPAPV